MIDKKSDKTRAKEEIARLKKEKDLEKKNQKRKGKPGGKIEQAIVSLSDFIKSEKTGIPLFLEKCVEFIQIEGLDSEGIYRVPGNRAHVDLLYQKFDEGLNKKFFIYENS